MPTVELGARPALLGARGLRIGLGLLWLLDGALQLQPFMFTRAFSQSVLRGTAAGQPGVLRAPILWVAHLVAAHPVPWNLVFALVQIAIGIGLLVPATQRVALVSSVFWAGGVWLFGEGLGNVLTGSGSPLTGAPGAVLVYGLLAVLAWPSAPAQRYRLGLRAAWAGLWTGSAVLWLLPSVRSPGAAADAIQGALPAAPGWLQGTLASLAGAVGGQGLSVALTLSLASLVIGLGVFWRRSRYQGYLVVAGTVLAMLLWVAGQSAGGLFTGQSTDPNIGPLFVLLGLALLPSTGAARIALRGRQRLAAGMGPGALRVPRLAPSQSIAGAPGPLPRFSIAPSSNTTA